MREAWRTCVWQETTWRAQVRQLSLSGNELKSMQCCFCSPCCALGDSGVSECGCQEWKTDPAQLKGTLQSAFLLSGLGLSRETMVAERGKFVLQSPLPNFPFKLDRVSYSTPEEVFLLWALDCVISRCGRTHTKGVVHVQCERMLLPFISSGTRVCRSEHPMPHEPLVLREVRAR